MLPQNSKELFVYYSVPREVSLHTWNDNIIDGLVLLGDLDDLLEHDLVHGQGLLAARDDLLGGEEEAVALVPQLQSVGEPGSNHARVPIVGGAGARVCDKGEQIF